jgi:excinuclease UvrABC nuclease subunit
MINKFNNLLFSLNTYISENSKILLCSIVTPLRLKTYKNLSLFPKIKNLKSDLYKIAGVYAFIHLPDGKQYIGSSSNLYERLSNHIRGKNSNINLQQAIANSGLDNFIFVIYYFYTDSNIVLTDIEKNFISSFPFETLYNIKKYTKSMLKYKHTNEAIEKIKLRSVNKMNHSILYNKHHTSKTLKARSKRLIGLFNQNNNLIKTYKNQVVLAKEFGVHKSTISKYKKLGKLFANKYYINSLSNNLNNTPKE